MSKKYYTDLERLNFALNSISTLEIAIKDPKTILNKGTQRYCASMYAVKVIFDEADKLSHIEKLKEEGINWQIVSDIRSMIDDNFSAGLSADDLRHIALNIVPPLKKALENRRDFTSINDAKKSDSSKVAQNYTILLNRKFGLEEEPNIELMKMSMNLYNDVSCLLLARDQADYYVKHHEKKIKEQQDIVEFMQDSQAFRVDFIKSNCSYKIQQQIPIVKNEEELEKVINSGFKKLPNKTQNIIRDYYTNHQILNLQMRKLEEIKTNSEYTSYLEKLSNCKTKLGKLQNSEVLEDFFKKIQEVREYLEQLLQKEQKSQINKLLKTNKYDQNLQDFSGSLKAYNDLQRGVKNAQIQKNILSAKQNKYEELKLEVKKYNNLIKIQKKRIIEEIKYLFKDADKMLKDIGNINIKSAYFIKTYIDNYKFKSFKKNRLWFIKTNQIQLNHDRYRFINQINHYLSLEKDKSKLQQTINIEKIQRDMASNYLKTIYSLQVEKFTKSNIKAYEISMIKIFTRYNKVDEVKQISRNVELIENLQEKKQYSKFLAI